MVILNAVQGRAFLCAASVKIPRFRIKVKTKAASAQVGKINGQSRLDIRNWRTRVPSISLQPVGGMSLVFFFFFPINARNENFK